MQSDAPKEVPVTEARLVRWPRTVRVQGSLMADEDAVVGAKLPGRVETVAIDIGDVVEKGQTLVTLDRRELDLRVLQAEAQLRQACAAVGMTLDDDEGQLDHLQSPPVMLERALVDEAQASIDRIRPLVAQRTVAAAEFDRLQAQLQTAQARYRSALNDVNEQIAVIGLRRAELSLAQQQAADTTIVAPFDAVVQQRSVAPGEYVQIGQAVATLVRVDHLRYIAGVPESKAADIRKGQRVEIHLAGRPQPFEAVISRISPTITQTSRSLLIEADVVNPDHQLQAGLFAEAEVHVDPQAQAMVVPREAISSFAGVQKVWTVRDGQSQQQTIQSGRRNAQYIEIIGGLAEGDSIVADAARGRAGPVVAITDAATELQAKSNPEAPLGEGQTQTGLFE